MNLSFILDQPLFVEAAFHPRTCSPGTSSFVGAVDGVFQLQNKHSVGFRLFPHPRSFEDKLPLFVLWHGNAELAAEYDTLAPMWCSVALGASLIVLDFPGYGWATGSPSLSQLGAVGEAISPAVMWETALKPAKLQRPSTTIIVGRSIGSVAATAQCLKHSDNVHGLLLDAGISALFDLPLVTGMLQELPQYISGVVTSGILADPFANHRKLAKLQLPLLLLHGDSDTLVPLEQAHANLQASAAPPELKSLREWPGCGHNDVLHRFGREFFEEVARFVARCAEAQQATQAAAAASSSAGSSSSFLCSTTHNTVSGTAAEDSAPTGSSCVLQ